MAFLQICGAGSEHWLIGIRPQNFRCLFCFLSGSYHVLGNTQYPDIVLYQARRKEGKRTTFKTSQTFDLSSKTSCLLSKMKIGYNKITEYAFTAWETEFSFYTLKKKNNLVMKHRDPPNFLWEMFKVKQSYHTGMVCMPYLLMKWSSFKKINLSGRKYRLSYLPMASLD